MARCTASMTERVYHSLYPIKHKKAMDRGIKNWWYLRYEHAASHITCNWGIELEMPKTRPSIYRCRGRREHEASVHNNTKLCCILDLERSRNRRQGSRVSTRKVDFMGSFLVACPTNMCRQQMNEWAYSRKNSDKHVIRSLFTIRTQFAMSGKGLCSL